ncbi:MAG TPA: glycosyltransferase family 2 protein [Catalimonadaceae bacterium]|jgi:glycosyltransferase involved in cell wall biosynthesis|nr:glycosyltransferase family 2 protein [Catalimonadaceae bacterium]
MDKKGLVSVIMPVYNVEKYISKSIESVLRQTYSNFELLIIDDGSPDGSAAIALEYVKSDSRIKLHHKKNGGLSDARNYGLDRAEGEYIYFIDSDDWIEPHLLETGLAALTSEKTDLVIFGYFLDTTDLDNNPQSQRPVFHKKARYDKVAGNLTIDENLMGLLGYAWNKIYKHSFLKSNNLHFDKGVSLVEDILFNAQVYKQTDALVILPDCLYHYLNRPVSTLIKTYHEGAFSLYLKKNAAVEAFLMEWKLDQRKTKAILSLSLMSGLRYSIRNLISFMDGFSDEEKVKRISELTSHRVVRSLVRYYKPAHFLDLVYVNLVRFRMNKMLYNLLKMR